MTLTSFMCPITVMRSNSWLFWWSFLMQIVQNCAVGCRVTGHTYSWSISMSSLKWQVFFPYLYGITSGGFILWLRKSLTSEEYQTTASRGVNLSTQGKDAECFMCKIVPEVSVSVQRWSLLYVPVALYRAQSENLERIRPTLSTEQ
jgi:hypothetical protein